MLYLGLIEDEYVHWLEITPEYDLTEDWFSFVHTCEQVPADELLDRFHGDWNGDLTRIYAEHSY